MARGLHGRACTFCRFLRDMLADADVLDEKGALLNSTIFKIR
jgi:hypothetical protein